MAGSVDQTENLSRSIVSYIEENSKWQTTVINAIHNFKTSNRRDESDNRNSPISQHITESLAKEFCHKLVSSLFYPEIDSRSDQIHEPTPKTFDWIFEPPSDSQEWHKFSEFLEGSQSLYWITGKPASGKSTLMKFLASDNRTVYHLNKWMSDKKLCILDFYFWISNGKEIQMSQEGLIRRLLHVAYQTFPQMWRTVFSKKWEAYAILGDQIHWNLKDLRDAFKAFTSEIVRNGFKIFILIDGLDEFRGSFSQQLELIQYIKSLLRPEIKICISSRPWNVFQDAFRQAPSLRLEDLTRPDIEYYVTSKFYSNPGFVALQLGDPGATIKLISNIVDKAVGVFLWVVLVVENLLEGFTDGERLLELQNRLDSLPPDLEDLFWNILGSVELGRAARFFRIFEASGSQLSLIQLSFADDNDPELAFKMHPGHLSSSERDSRVTIIARRLNACCKGLLEPQRSRSKSQDFAEEQISYLHKTVKDFFKRQDVWSKFVNASLGFDPQQAVYVSHICHFKTFLEPDALANGNEKALIKRIISCLNGVGQPQPKFTSYQGRLLDEFYRTVSLYLKSERQGATEWQQPIWTKENFLYLATAFRLHSYVSWKLESLPPSHRVGDLQLLLKLSLGGYQIPYKLQLPWSDDEDPDPSFIKILLDFGADINSPIPDEKGHNVSSSVTAWDLILTYYRHIPELSKLALQYGAEPFRTHTNFLLDKPQVSSLLIAKRREGQFRCSARASARFSLKRKDRDRDEEKHNSNKTRRR